jgi:hypothetical protein
MVEVEFVYVCSLTAGTVQYSRHQQIHIPVFDGATDDSTDLDHAHWYLLV